jgi:putative glutamine amidotransferase
MIVAVSQRVDPVEARGERRDALDQRWARLLHAAGLGALPLPNHRETAIRILGRGMAHGLVLTGGNTLATLGGDAPERDETELALVDHARRAGWPILGVCRGMQLLQQTFGVKLGKVDGHIAPLQAIEIDGARQTVNSFHEFGTRDTCDDLLVWARAEDGVVKAIRHRTEPISGIMWHPERIAPFRPEDLALLGTVFAMEASS